MASPGRAWRAGLLIWLLLGVLFSARSAAATLPGEYDVKAVFLLNFAKFVEWPPRVHGGSNSPIIIGIVGTDPFGGSLEKIFQGQTAQGRPIEVRQLRAEEDCRSCHIVFLCRSVAGQAKEILKSLGTQPVLTVSEADDFVKEGGMIGFAIVDKSVRFDINTRTAAAAELRLSSKLLAVARTTLK